MLPMENNKHIQWSGIHHKKINVEILFQKGNISKTSWTSL